MIPLKVIYLTLSLFFFAYGIQNFPQKEILIEVSNSKH